MLGGSVSAAGKMLHDASRGSYKLQEGPGSSKTHQKLQDAAEADNQMDMMVSEDGDYKEHLQNSTVLGAGRPGADSLPFYLNRFFKIKYECEVGCRDRN